MPDELPTFDELRGSINLAALMDGEWAGAPMPIPGIPLVVEPRYPYQGLNGFKLDGADPKPEWTADDYEDIPPIVHNSWYATARNAMVYVCSDTIAGKRYPVMLPQWGGARLQMWIGTIGASAAWSLESEYQAMIKLNGHVTDTAWRSYCLTGTFLETSPRSGVTYLFRKLRPTVAIKGTRDGGTKILAALCMHPIGLYSGTWGGVMCPTDDVLAHLLLMRADEHFFWKKANSHESWRPEAGI